MFKSQQGLSVDSEQYRVLTQGCKKLEQTLHDDYKKRADHDIAHKSTANYLKSLKREAEKQAKITKRYKLDNLNVLNQYLAGI